MTGSVHQDVRSGSGTLHVVELPCITLWLEAHATFPWHGGDRIILVTPKAWKAGFSPSEATCMSSVNTCFPRWWSVCFRARTDAIAGIMHSLWQHLTSL